MRWYWAINCSNTVDEPFVSDADDLKGFQDWQLWKGKPIENWRQDAWIRCTDPECDGDPDDVLQTHLGIPIYSFRLQKIIREAGFPGIQFLPIRVLRRDGTEIPGFAVANIVNLLSAMDMEKSEYDVFEEDDPVPERHGRVSGVYKMVLKGVALTGYDIVRVKEFPPSEYVSERFKLQFEAANCTGYSFQETRTT